MSNVYEQTKSKTNNAMLQNITWERSVRVDIVVTQECYNYPHLDTCPGLITNTSIDQIFLSQELFCLRGVRREAMERLLTQMLTQYRGRRSMPRRPGLAENQAQVKGCFKWSNVFVNNVLWCPEIRMKTVK